MDQYHIDECEEEEAISNEGGKSNKVDTENDDI